jgi:hypothetical protein
LGFILPLLDELSELVQRPVHVEARDVHRNARLSVERYPAPLELLQQLLDPDSPAWHDLILLEGGKGPASPCGVAACEPDAGGGAAVKANQVDLAARSLVMLDEVRCHLRKPPAVLPVARRVVLVLRLPPPVDAHEGQFRAGELFDLEPLLSEEVNHGPDHTGVERELGDLRVLVQQAVRQENDLSDHVETPQLVGG